MAAERRRAASLDHAQEFTLPMRGIGTRMIRERSHLRLDLRFTCAALSGERALARRRNPPLGRELDDDEGGKIEIQPRQSCAREDDRIDARVLRELAYARRDVATQGHGLRLRREATQQRTSPKRRRTDARAGCERQQAVLARRVEFAAN